MSESFWLICTTCDDYTVSVHRDQKQALKDAYSSRDALVRLDSLQTWDLSSLTLSSFFVPGLAIFVVEHAEHMVELAGQYGGRETL